jgi:hypothetical protein
MRSRREAGYHRGQVQGTVIVWWVPLQMLSWQMRW